MFLQDFQEVINILAKALGGKCTCCFKSISVNYFGDKFIFDIDGDAHYVMNVENGRVTKEYKDTWRNPAHKEVIREGRRAY